MGYEKNKRHRQKGRFFSIPNVVAEHPDYISLGANSIRLLNEAALQYNGRNNGKLCFVWSQMSKRGWKSKETLQTAKNELVSKNLLIVSKYGGIFEGKGMPQYYAITWQPIDEILGFEMDVEPTIMPVRSFSI